MSMSIQEDDSLTEIDGEIAVLYIETRDVGGKVLDHSQLEGQAVLLCLMKAQEWIYHLIYSHSLNVGRMIQELFNCMN